MDTGETDMNVAWEEACNAFREAAGVDLDPKFSEHINDLQAQFDGRKGKDTKHDRRIERLKGAWTKALICIDRVGAIAAEGASMAFGSPASIAGSALTFLVKATIAYQQVFDDLDSILSDIVSVLERFEVYRKNADALAPPMIRVANKVLLTVVRICGLCHGILRRNKVKLFLKLTFFDDDGGVAAQIKQLRKLQEEELQMKGTLNLIATDRARKSLETGFDHTNTRLEHVNTNVEDVRTHLIDVADLQYLREALNIDDVSKTLTEYDRYKELLLPGSCSWLHNDAVYRDWFEGRRRSEVLCIVGDEGCGKTFALTAIVQKLLRRPSEHASSSIRTSVAFFYIGRRDMIDQSTIMTEMVYDLVWQSAHNDPSYLKRVAGICRRGTNEQDSLGLWKKLFLDCCGEDSEFYFVIDGVHSLNEVNQRRFLQLIRSLASAPRTLHKKVIISAREEFARAFSAGISSATTLSIERRNRDDVARYVKSRLSVMGIFRRNDDDTKKLLTSVCDGLMEAASGSFLRISTSLSRIESAYDEQEVMTIVESAKKAGTLSESIESIVKRLNRDLSAKEIAQLNTVLLWTMFAVTPLSVLQMEAVISLEHGDVPLRPLYSQIRERLSELLVLKTDGVHDEDDMLLIQLRSETIRDFFVRDDHEVQDRSANQPTAREIRMLKRLITTVCDPDMYAEMGFDDFFNQKKWNRVSEITVEHQNAHLLISKFCLRSLVMGKEDFDRYSWLRRYASDNLLFHLESIHDDISDATYATDIGSSLVQILRQPSSMEKAMDLSSPFHKYSYRYWSFQDRLIREVLRLLRSPIVMETVMATPGEDRDWVHSIRASSSPETEILLPLARYAAGALLAEGKKVGSDFAFIWLVGMLNKGQHTGDPDQHTRIEGLCGVDYDPTYIYKGCICMDQLPSSMILATFDFARALLEGNKIISESETSLSLSDVYAACGRREDAIKTLLECVSLDHDSFDILWRLADHHGELVRRGQLEHFDSAISYGLRALDLAERDQGPDMIDSIRSDMLECSLACKRYDDVEKVLLEQISAEGSSEFKILCSQEKLLVLMCMQDRDDDVIALMEQFSTEIFPGVTTTRLTQMLQDLSYGGKILDWRWDNFEGVVNVFKRKNMLENLKSYCREALDFADRRADEEQWSFNICREKLKYNLADLLYQYPQDEAESEHAVEMWEELVDRNDSRVFDKSPGYRSALRLAPIYIQQAVDNALISRNVEEVTSKIKALGLVDGVPDGSRMLTEAEVRSILCRYHVAIGNVEQAKSTIKSNLVAILDLLEAGENDSFFALAYVFINLGQDADAIVALNSVTQSGTSESGGTNTVAPGLETNAEDLCNNIIPANASENNAKAQEEPTFNNKDSAKRIEENGYAPAKPIEVSKSPSSECQYLLTCKGDCGHGWTSPEDIYICRRCMEMQLCPSCREQVVSKKERGKLCDPMHAFLYVPPRADAEHHGANVVVVGDRKIPVNEWLGEIRREWDGIETSTLW